MGIEKSKKGVKAPAYKFFGLSNKELQVRNWVT
jgi:hypothetical protein